jgi:outer membrane protein assembly factor BamB
VYLGGQVSGEYGFFAIDEDAPGAYVDSQKYLVNGIKWSYPTREIQSRAAIAADGSIFVTQLANYNPTGVLYKFTPQGSVVWQFPLPKGSPDYGPAVGPDGTVYACSGDHYLNAVTPAGNLKWKFKLTDGGRSPVVGDPSQGGAVYLTSINWTLFRVPPAGSGRVGREVEHVLRDLRALQAPPAGPSTGGPLQGQIGRGRNLLAGANAVHPPRPD